MQCEKQRGYGPASVDQQVWRVRFFEDPIDTSMHEYVCAMCIIRLSDSLEARYVFVYKSRSRRVAKPWEKWPQRVWSKVELPDGTGRANERAGKC